MVHDIASIADVYSLSLFIRLLRTTVTSVCRHMGAIAVGNQSGFLFVEMNKAGRIATKRIHCLSQCSMMIAHGSMK